MAFKPFWTPLENALKISREGRPGEGQIMNFNS
jgi:hypothetical protein